MRPFVKIILNDKVLNAVIDTGAMHSYIRSEFTKDCLRVPVQPLKIELGGKSLYFKEAVLISGEICDSKGKKYQFSELFFEVENLGTEKDKKIDAIIGAILQEKWGAIINNSVKPPEVDFYLLRKGEITEL